MASGTIKAVASKADVNALNDQIATINSKLIQVANATGTSFNINFASSGVDVFALIYGRFSWDPTKLSIGIISHPDPGSASIVNLGSETASVSCSGHVVTVTLNHISARVTVMSKTSYTLSKPD